MKLGKFIVELLHDYDAVIVPGLGAFEKEYQPAQFDESTNAMLPPQTRVRFNPKFRNDDGLLVGYVSQSRRVSQFYALQKIEQARDLIIDKLDRGQKVAIDHLGELFYDDKNELVFVPEKENFEFDTFGLTAASMAGADTKGEQADQVTGATCTVQEKKDELPDWMKQEHDEPARKRKRGWLYLLIVLLPLAAISVFAFLKNNNSRESQPDTGLTNVTSAESSALVDSMTTGSMEPDSLQLALDSVQPTEVADSSEVETAVVPETDSAAVSGNKFYLVGGAFKEEQNALDFVKELKAKGYQSFPLGKYGRFFVVGIGAYDTEEEANAAKNEYLQKNPDSGVWILER